TELLDPTIKGFEAALAELDSIVKTLEDGDLPLEKSLELYERGVQPSRFCHSKLEGAERRIGILNHRGEIRPPPPTLGLDTDSNRAKGRPPHTICGRGSTLAAALLMRRSR